MRMAAHNEDGAARLPYRARDHVDTIWRAHAVSILSIVTAALLFKALKPQQTFLAVLSVLCYPYDLSASPEIVRFLGAPATTASPMS
ncbi:hypothetical protein GCM10027404_22090 [Arthrobacter tumbae]|nr:hypothetical protein [Arthrobacter tumbae]